MNSRLTKISFLLLCLFGLSLSACSNRIQITEYPTQREATLSSLGSYCWANSSPQNALEKVEPIGGHQATFDQTIHQAVDAELRQLGYQKTDCATAQFMVDYRMNRHEDVAAMDANSTSENEQTPSEYGFKWKIGDDHSVDYKGLSSPEEQLIILQHGMLHIAAFSKAGKMLWHSSAEKTLNDQDADNTRKANLEKAVNKLMVTFPARN